MRCPPLTRVAARIGGDKSPHADEACSASGAPGQSRAMRRRGLARRASCALPGALLLRPGADENNLEKGFACFVGGRDLVSQSWFCVARREQRERPEAKSPSPGVGPRRSARLTGAVVLAMGDRRALG